MLMQDKCKPEQILDTSIVCIVAQAHHVRLDQAHLKGAACMLDGRDGRGSCATIVTADLDDVSICLGNTRRHSPDTGLSHQFNADLCCGSRL